MRSPVKPAARLIGAVMIMSATPMHAQGSDWNQRITLYGWGSSLDGDIGVAPLPDISVSRGFSDTLSSLDFAAMAVYEARKDRWGLLIDVQAVNLSERGRIPGLGTPGHISTELQGALLAGTYRLSDSDRGYLDLIAGLRYWSIDTNASLELPPGTPFPFPTRARDSRSTTVFQVGVKGTWAFDGPMFLTGWAMGGAGGSTDLSSDAMVALGYTISPRMALMIGFRRVDLKHSARRLDLDMSLQGPGLALDVRFD